LNLISDPFKQHEGVTYIARLLSIVEVFKTPHERRGVVTFSPHITQTLKADDIVQIFEAIVKSPLVSVLLKLAEGTNNPRLQVGSRITKLKM
jgi:hypothetical protein